MGTPYSSVAVSGYNSSPPSDDGTQVDSNKVYWSTAKTKLGDPLNTAIAAINTALVTALDYTAAEKTTNYTTLASDNGRIIEIGSTVSSAVTITLGQVASMGTSYIVSVVNRSTISQTVVRGGTDTINGSITSITLPSKCSLTFQVNASNNGYDVIAAVGYQPGDLTVAGSILSPTLVAPALGTPASGVLTNCTGTAAGLTAGTASAVAVGGITGLGTGVATALAINVGSAGAPVTFNGALGTPSSGTVTNLTGTASININGTVGATTPTTGAFTTVSASGNVGIKGGGTTTAMLELGGTMAAISSAAKEVHILNATNPIVVIGKDGNDYAYMQQVTGSPSYFQMGYRAIGDQIKFIDTGLTTIGGASAYGLDVAGTLKPTTDNTVSCGSGSFRWSVVYAGTGTINTSDAREKTVVSPMTPSEIEASKQLAREIGIYKWLSAVAEKGEAARKHVGFTVQRAIEIMQANGLDPMAYGFICYDQWPDEFVEHDAIEARDAVLDEDGNVIEAAIEAKAAWTEQTKHAGDRYAFRYDELNMFIARGFEARLAALEAA